MNFGDSGNPRTCVLGEHLSDREMGSQNAQDPQIIESLRALKGCSRTVGHCVSGISLPGLQSRFYQAGAPLCLSFPHVIELNNGIYCIRALGGVNEKVLSSSWHVPVKAQEHGLLLLLPALSTPHSLHAYSTHVKQGLLSSV